MTLLKRVGMLVAVLIAMASMPELGERLSIQGVSGFVTTAEAVVGRPLTRSALPAWRGGRRGVDLLLMPRRRLDWP